MTANDIKKLRAQHEIVEKQLLQLILENQAACDDELEKYTRCSITVFMVKTIFFIFSELEHYKMI